MRVPERDGVTGAHAGNPRDLPATPEIHHGIGMRCVAHEVATVRGALHVATTS